MIFRAIAIICAAILVSCSKPPQVRWVPKDGLSVIRVKDGKRLFSSADMRDATIVVDADGTNRTIWLGVSKAYSRYFELSIGELLTLQMNDVRLATFAVVDRTGTGPPAFPVPDKRNPDGSWLSAAILNRLEEPAEQ